MAEPVLAVRGLRKAFGAVRAADGLDLDVRAGEIHALIGPNGAGKSTTIALIAGELRADFGSVHISGRDVGGLSVPARARLGLGRTHQVSRLFPAFDVLDNLIVAVAAARGLGVWRRARAEPGLIDAARRLLETFALADWAEAPAGTLPHGVRRHVELAMAMAAAPKLLLLDEPLAGMGAEDSAETVARIEALKADAGVLLVEHDMDAVFALADRITVLVGGRAIAGGPPSAIRADAAVQRAYLGDEGAADA